MNCRPSEKASHPPNIIGCTLLLTKMKPEGVGMSKGGAIATVDCGRSGGFDLPPWPDRPPFREAPSFLSLPRQKIEELSRRVAEERSRREEEARRLEAEQAREKEELALRLAEEERERSEREEGERLQKQVWTLPQPGAVLRRMGCRAGVDLPQPGTVCTGAERGIESMLALAPRPSGLLSRRGVCKGGRGSL